MKRRAVVVVSGILWFLGSASPMRAAEAGLDIRLSSASGTLSVDRSVPLRSAVAEVQELGDGCQFLTLCLSSLPGVDCGTARSVDVPHPAFVLVVGIRLPAGTSAGPGEWTDIGVELRGTAARYRAHGDMGAVLVEDVDDVVRGSLAINSAELKVSGRFSAVLRSPEEPNTRASGSASEE